MWGLPGIGVLISDVISASMGGGIFPGEPGDRDKSATSPTAAVAPGFTRFSRRVTFDVRYFIVLIGKLSGRPALPVPESSRST
jgi:hypothetical protein